MTDTLDIKTKVTPAADRAEVIARLRAHEPGLREYGAIALHLYGSAARDEMTDESDVDLFIDYDPLGDLDLFKLCGLQRFVSAALGRKVDLTTRDGLHSYLKNRIERSSIEVY